MTTIAWDAVNKVLLSDSQFSNERADGTITKGKYEHGKIQRTRFKTFCGRRVMAYGIAGTIQCADMMRLQFCRRMETLRLNQCRIMLVTEDHQVYVFHPETGWAGYGDSLTVYIGSGANYKGGFFDRVLQDPYSGGKFWYCYSLYTKKVTKGLFQERFDNIEAERAELSLINQQETFHPHTNYS
jgi:hypothetical protein